MSWASQPLPVSWLERMREAAANLDYNGILVHQHNGRLETLRIEHGHDDQGRERERLTALSGEKREILRDGDSLLCILPANRPPQPVSGRQPPQLRGFLSVAPRELLKHYRIQLDGEDRIAGRSTQRLMIEPLDDYRYGLHLYLDKEYGLPLKTEMYNEQGKMVSQLMFTEIAFEPLTLEYSPAAGQPPAERSTRRATGEPYVEATAGWRFESLPEGFEPRLHIRRTGKNGSDAVEHFVFSDGLATLSLYVELPDHPGERLNGISRAGSVNAYGHPFDDYHATAVGEVPMATLKRVARSPRPVGEGDD
jgi:sigma-E factor negative regulatory protein RseB